MLRLSDVSATETASVIGTSAVSSRKRELSVSQKTTRNMAESDLCKNSKTAPEFPSFKKSSVKSI